MKVGCAMDELGLYGTLKLGIMLMAFLVAFYALVSRERRIPSLIDSIFIVTYGLSIALLFILAINFDLKADLKNALVIALMLVIVVLVYHIFGIHNRLKNLRRDQKLKNSWIGRTLKNIRRRQKTGRTYEHYASNIPPTLSKSISKSQFMPLKKNKLHNDKIDLPFTAIYHLRSHRESDEIIVDLAKRFINEGLWVQYTTCSRHPIEFLIAIKEYFKSSSEQKDWEKQSRRIVVVDAFTTHFGFTDSIYSVKSDDAEKMCLKLVKAKSSFAGIHTATAKAFNHIKDQIKNNSREPTLVIYEGLHSLVDLESDQQYRIFYSHVLPSERLWGGMLTVVVEFSPSDQNLNHIRTFGDIFYTTLNHSKNDLKKEMI